MKELYFCELLNQIVLYNDQEECNNYFAGLTKYKVVLLNNH